ncbi:hypothetical protein B0H11DRAFT_2006739 [Mycena galericulata]|nr:hypothetical protein B0H11DRAFT_2006739 [Mycena galericulata]
MRLTSVFYSAPTRVYTLRLLICVHILALAVGISFVIDDIQFGWEPFLSERLGDVLLLVTPCIVLAHHVLAWGFLFTLLGSNMSADLRASTEFFPLVSSWLLLIC